MKRQDRIVPSLPVVVQIKKGIDERVAQPHVMMGRVGVGNVEASFDERARQKPRRAQVAFVNEDLVVGITPHVGLGFGVSAPEERLGLNRVEDIDAKGWNDVFPEVFVLVVSKNEDEVRPKLVNGAPKLSHSRKVLLPVPGGEALIPDLRTLARLVWVFFCFVLSACFFRAGSASQAVMVQGKILAAFLNPADYFEQIVLHPAGVGLIAALVVIEWLGRRHDHPLHIERLARPVRWVIYTSLIWVTLTFMPDESKPFVYFQF